MTPPAHESPRRPRPSWHRRAARVALVTAIGVVLLAAVDLLMSIAFRLPADPRQPLRRVQSLLWAGSSAEKKLAFMVRPADDASGPLVAAGWVDSTAQAVIESQWEAPVETRQRVSVFGSSFSNEIGRRLHDYDATIDVSLYAGPGSPPPNHSFALYRASRRFGGQADVVVFSILASSLPGMASMTGLTWMADATTPAPYTYPRYFLDAGSKTLREGWPSIRTSDDLRQAIANPTRWTVFRGELAAGDAYYQPMLFRRNLLDRSTAARLMRHAYAKWWMKHVSARIDLAQEAVPVLHQMCEEFADSARRDNQLPIVLLIQDRGGREDLSKLVGPTLSADGIASISTQEILGPSDATNFESDGRFTAAADEQVARALFERIRAAK